MRYHEPHIGIAAVAVLEAAGFEVTLPRDRRCCGRPAFSQGNLNAAADLGRHNLDILAADTSNAPVLFLEPSCWSMFAQDYRELKLAGAEQIASRCFLFEQFIEDLLAREPEALRFNGEPAFIAIHAHCHAKALVNPAFMARLARRLPQRRVTLLDTGCCGMAGAFGALATKYELSLKVAQPLVDKIQAQPSGKSWSPPAPVAAIRSSTSPPRIPSTLQNSWPMLASRNDFQREGGVIRHVMVEQELHGVGADIWRATSTSISPRWSS